MTTLSIIGLELGFTITVMAFLLLMNGNFLKERTAILEDRLYDAKRLHKAWHFWKAFVYGTFFFWVSIHSYLFTNNELISILNGAFCWVFTWSFGDMLLNKAAGYDTFERGDKSGMDWFSFPVRLIIMAVVITLIFVSCDGTNTPIKGNAQKTDISFIPDTVQKSVNTIPFKGGIPWAEIFKNGEGYQGFYLDGFEPRYFNEWAEVCKYMEKSRSRAIIAGSIDLKKIYFLEVKDLNIDIK